MRGLEHITPGAMVVDVASLGEPLCTIIASQPVPDHSSARVTMCCMYLDGSSVHVRTTSWWTTKDGSLLVLGCPEEARDGTWTV